MVDATGLRTRFEREEQSTGLALWQVTNRWQAAQRAVLKPFGLTHVQFVLLASLTWLGSHGDLPVTQRTLADFAGADPMMTSQVVRALQRKGWLRREPNPADRRAVSLAVTTQGLRLVNEAVVAVEACDDAFFEPIEQDRTAFTALLGALVRPR